MQLIALFLLILLLASLTPLSFTVCASETQGDISYSGPVSTPREAESAAIRNAPAYNTALAASFIEDMPQIRALIDGAEDENALTCFGEARPSEEAFQKLEGEISRLSEGGHKVSLVMVDLATRSGVSYHSAIPMCAQSTIKGIYIGALLDERPQALEENGQYMHDAVVFSANEPYHCLRSIYGSAPIEKWCREAGVDTGFASDLYPRTYTARDMFKMWTRLYAFLNSKAQGSPFASWFADSSCSATKKQLGNRFPVQTKAGWESGLDENQNYDPYAVIPPQYTDGDPANDECAINDTGVVYTENGPYLFVIYTDHPFGVFKDYVTVNPLYGLTEVLYQLQASLTIM